MAWYNGGAWGGLPIARLFEILVDIQDQVNNRLDGDVLAPVDRPFPCAREVKAFAQEVLDVLTAEAARTTPFVWVTADGGETAVDLEFLGLDGFSLAGFERPHQTAYWGKLRDAIGKLRYKKRVVTGESVDSWCTGRAAATNSSEQTSTSYHTDTVEPTTIAQVEAIYQAEWDAWNVPGDLVDRMNAEEAPEIGAWSTGGPAVLDCVRTGYVQLPASCAVRVPDPVQIAVFFNRLMLARVRQHGGLRFGVGGLEDVSKRRFTWALSADAAESVDTDKGTLCDGDTTEATGAGTYEILLEGVVARAAVADDAEETAWSGTAPISPNPLGWYTNPPAELEAVVEASLTCTQIEVWQDIGAV